MVSKYDVFYIIATKGQVRTIDIVDALQKPRREYNNIHNKVKELEKEGYITKKGAIKVLHNERSKKLFELVSFCLHHSMNYNLLFKKEMIGFLQNAAKKEFFTIKNMRMHNQTFNFYTTLLSKYGVLLIIARKPLKCKLLRHHFLIDLFKFFNKKVTFYAPTRHNFIPEINKEFKVYKRNLKIQYSLIKDIAKKEEVNFVHLSLHLEGNPVTLPDTQKIILEDIIPKEYKMTSIQEVTNYKKAVDLMLANSEKGIDLNLAIILEYHQITMQHIKGAGVLRTQNVIIKRNPHFKTCDWKSIPTKIDALIKKYSQFEKEKNDVGKIISFAAFFHNVFQRIHPFIDGNSRTSRLVMLHILRRHKIPILNLPVGYADMYLDLTKRSRKRDDEAFQHLIEEIVFFNLKNMNAALR